MDEDHLALRPGHAGGGPKAVIADHRWQQRRLHVSATHQRLQLGAPAVPAHDSDVVDAVGDASDRPPAGDADGDSDAGGDSDDSLQRCRAARRAQLRVASTMPSHGAVLEPRDAGHFLDAISAADPRSRVVVLLYEPYIPAAVVARSALDVVARRHLRVLFVAVRSCVVSRGGLDAIALPALTIYRGGALEMTILRLQERLDLAEGAAAIAGALEAVMGSCGVLA